MPLTRGGRRNKLSRTAGCGLILLALLAAGSIVAAGATQVLAAVQGVGE